MPGCILSAQPIKWTADGHLLAEIPALGDLKALIRRSHLPPRLLLQQHGNASTSAKLKPLNTVCIACQQNSHLLVVAAHPDITALSKVEKRAWPEEYRVGQKMTGKVYEVDKQKNVYFRLEPDETGREPLVTVKALRINLGGFTLFACFSTSSIRLE